MFLVFLLLYTAWVHMKQICRLLSLETQVYDYVTCSSGAQQAADM